MKTLKICAFFLLMISCKKEKPLVQDENIYDVTLSKFNSMAAYFNSNDNRLTLNWTEQTDTLKTNILKYRVFDKERNEFGEIVTVPPSLGMQSHHESMAKIVRTGKGVHYAIFRVKTPNSKRRFAGKIYYSISTDEGKTWSPRKLLVTDEKGYSQSFYDAILLPDGEIGMTWLDSRRIEEDKDGSTLYFAKTNGELGFENQKPIAGSTCQCCRTDIYVTANKTIQIAFRNITEGSIRDMYIVESKDNGYTFSKPELMGEDNWKIDGCPHTGPSFAYNNTDLGVVWYTGAESGDGIFFKKLQSEMQLLESKQLITITGRHPQMTASANGNYYIVYEDFYKVDNKSYSHIVLDVLKPDGSVVKTNISKEKTHNDHAVITNIDDKQIIIAWNNVEGDKTKIQYKKILI